MNGYQYVKAHDLMYSIVIYSNGSIFTVGNVSQYIAEPSIDYARVIRHTKVIPTYTDKFKSFIYDSGFLKLPNDDKEGDKSNLICELFYYSQYSNHKVCRPDTMSHPIIDSIYEYIESLIGNYTSKDIYRPMKIFVESKNVLSKDIGHFKLIGKTSRSIFQDFDPDSKFMRSDYSLSSYVSYSMNYKSYNAFIEASNNHNVYTDGYAYIAFIVYIEGISVNDHPAPFSPTYNSWDTTSSSRNNDFPWQIFLFGFLIIFFSACVIFIIRRFYVKKNNSDSQDFTADHSSNNESSDDQKVINPQMTSYPIFVQSNHPQMTTYPIFVQSNPQMIPQMQTNVPIIFPQPQVFYPIQTNSNQ